jgi:membrane protease YdiL (CAAX protease family)
MSCRPPSAGYLQAPVTACRTRTSAPVLSRVRRVLLWFWPILRDLLLFFAWNILISAVLAISLRLGYGVVGVPVMVLLYAWFLRRLVTHPRVAPARLALLRLRALRGEALRWSLIAIPVLLILSWSLGEVYVRLVPVPPESFDPFGELMRTPAGRLAVTVLAVGIAPVLEEFFFRGFIQRALERRVGAPAGIAIAAAIFGAVHVLPWVFPLHFFLGLAFGYAVYATRSIWTGVILHAANNAAAVVGLGLEGEEPTPAPTLWQVGLDVDWWISLGVLLVSGAAALIVAGKLRKAGQEARLRPAEAVG